MGSDLNTAPSSSSGTRYSNPPSSAGGISGMEQQRASSALGYVANKAANAIRTATGIKGSSADVRTKNNAIPEKGSTPQYRDTSQSKTDKSSPATAAAAQGREMSARKSAATALRSTYPAVVSNAAKAQSTTQKQSPPGIRHQQTPSSNLPAKPAGPPGLRQAAPTPTPQQKSNANVQAQNAKQQQRVQATKAKTRQASRPIEPNKPMTTANDDFMNNMRRGMGQLEEKTIPKPVKESFEQFLLNTFLKE